uniref:ATP synthase gamma chain n=1 Tax=Buchnera aphidicola subsp. Schlechtendalia chinensis TaxID=118110 RepID=ATPG_BUCSC|nr:RecName: Full=ATP synthase gamma chain; AltName: Full=ATP synthase F1 sector gamma subunit; AltName: Full=F-ATPase gamma subunit [Buchnera aphidicola (Schlechtendalia chinensis)]AAF13781.1 gamma subunit of membrane-bound ATP synthase [Buchnera aphidicola]
MSEKKEIKNKINCISNTKKITKAMEMVSIAKMKKSEIKMKSRKPYLDIIKTIISHILYNHIKYRHLYLNNRKTKKIGIIVISTDRGLCGSLNISLFKKIIQLINIYKNKNVMSSLFILGSKGVSYFKSSTYDITYYEKIITKNYTFFDCLNFIHSSLEYYNTQKIDKLFLSYNQFKNTLVYIPVIMQLLPLSKKIFKGNKNSHWDYIYESNSGILLDTLLNDYIESQIYQSILENCTCEQASRMISMKQATDNSEDLIKKLRILYNKARQDNITQELTEIISGANAVSLY